MKTLKLIVWATFILMQPGLVFAGHLKAIDDLPSWKNFVEIMRKPISCGQLSVHEYENSKVFWKRFFLYVPDPVPNPFLTIRLDKASGEIEIWLDKDRDGHSDEYYSRKPDPETNVYPKNVFLVKYPTICDAVK